MTDANRSRGADHPWRERFLASTRGRTLAMLRRGERTAAELAEPLGITENAVRGHLAALERDGLVEARGHRREGVGKPPRLYAATAAAEELFPKAYDNVLSGVLDVLEERQGTDRLRSLLREAGRRAGQAAGADTSVTDASPADRVTLACRVLAELGAEMQREKDAEGLWLRGYACPLGALVSDHPELCGLVEALLAEITGRPVREHCRREDPLRPRCAFLVTEA